MDLSKLSDEDLKALYANDYKKLSDEGLKHIHSEVSQEKIDEQQVAASQPQPAAPEETTFQKVSNAVAPYAGAAEVAMEHPLLTGAAALAAGKALGNVPVVGPAVTNAANYVAGKTIPGYNFAKNAMTGLGNAAEKFADVAGRNTNLDTYKNLQHTASQYVKSGHPVPQGLIDTLKDIEGKIIAQQTGSVPPTVTAPNVGAAAAEGEGLMGRMGNLVGKVGPALGEAASTVGRAVAPVLRVASGPLGQGAMLALHSGELNTGEAQQLAQIHKFQDNFAKLPPAQQSAYYNLPRDKQIQIHAMIMSGQNPSNILGQTNALTSGYSQQLQQLAR